MIKQNNLYMAIALACCVAPGLAMAQQTTAGQSSASTAQTAKPRASVSTTSNNTMSNDTRRVQQLGGVTVQAQSLTLGDGLMSVQTAPKAVSTISREAITQSAPGGTYVQMIDSIPGVNASTDDVTGLNDGNYSIRGFTNDEIGATVNGAPINDSGNYKIYSTEYGDTENMGDITVLQGYPDVDTPIAGAAGGSIAWVTIDPSHTGGLDVSQTLGNNDYRRTFLRLQTGDLGPVRSWLSYSNNSADMWRGAGQMNVTKIDGKSVWTIDDNDSVTASFQYNRETKNSYDSLTKAQIAQNGYDSSYNTVYTGNPFTDKNYYKLHFNPFRSWLLSLDGEFRLSDNLRLSVVPYFWYGYGGGSSGATFKESTSTLNQFQYTNQDLNGDGKVGGTALAYGLSTSYTYRPGIIAKLNEDFGEDNSLEYGFWWDGPRQQQAQVFSPVDPFTGVPSDTWGQTDLIRYPDGTVQKTYAEYTQTDTRKFFATDTWTPNDKWTFTLGAAYLWERRAGFDYQWPGSVRKYYSQIGGHFAGTYHKVSPTAGVKYQLNDENQFYLGVGKTFRAPINGALLQNAAVANAPGALPASNYAVKPETATTADLGWRFYGGRFSASVDAYASNLHNKQVSGYDENSGNTVYLALPSVQMRGVSGEASYKLAQAWTLYGTYTFSKATLKNNVNTLGDGIYNTAGKTFLNTPKNSGYLRLSYNQGPFWANINAKYRGAIWGDWSNTEKAGGYTVFNFNAGWKFHDFSQDFRKPYIKLNLFNLTNKKALTYANNIGSFLASNPDHIEDANGNVLYASAPYYSLLQSRAVMVTFGASFF